MSEWQPIETAPRDGTEVDLWVVDKISSLEWREPDAFYEDDRWVTLSIEGVVEMVGYPGIQEPTHWMPLPIPPRR